jgi:hypothetical protein
MAKPEWRSTGRPARANTHLTRGRGDRREPSCRSCCLRSGQGHERSLVPGDQPQRRKGGNPAEKYSKRWGIECSFRDTKDPHFGMGMGQIRINSPQRRDRLWLLNALAVAVLTMLGAAGEALGFDKHLKASTPSGGHTPCSDKVALITSSFQPCRKLDCGRSWKSSASSCSSNRCLPIFTDSFKMRGILRYQPPLGELAQGGGT